MARQNVLMRPTRNKNFILGLVLAAGTLAIGCGSHDPQTIAAHRIADALPDVIGPAKHYDVTVEGNTFSLARGHASRVKIDGKDVQLEPSLVVNELHVDARDMAFNTKTKKVEHAGRVDVTGIVGQLNLDRYLANAKTGIDGLQVQIRWTDLEVTVPVSALHMTTTVRVDGTLAPSIFGPDKLDFVPNGADIGPVPVPRKLVQLAIDRINPVLDLSTLKFPVTIDSAQAVNGRLYITGTSTLVSK